MGMCCISGCSQLSEEKVAWKPPHLEVVLLLFVLDPLEGLLLGVDTQREARGAGCQNTILYGQLIWG